MIPEGQTGTEKISYITIRQGIAQGIWYGLQDLWKDTKEKRDCGENKVCFFLMIIPEKVVGKKYAARINDLTYLFPYSIFMHQLIGRF